MKSLWLAPVSETEPREQFVPRWDGKKPQKYSPCGRVGGFHMRRYQGFAVPTYGGTRNAWPMKAANT